MPLQNKVRLIAEERRHRVLQLKMAGDSDRQIAEQVGVSKNQVQRDWKKRLGELAREDIHAAAVIRTLAMLRYEALFLRWWNIAIDPKVPILQAAAASEMILKILNAERELNGLDPKKPITINIDGRQQTLIELFQSPGLSAERRNALLSAPQAALTAAEISQNGNSDQS